MARINFYGQNRHTLVVDGIPLSGFAEGPPRRKSTQTPGRVPGTL